MPSYESPTPQNTVEEEDWKDAPESFIGDVEEEINKMLIDKNTKKKLKEKLDTMKLNRDWIISIRNKIKTIEDATANDENNEEKYKNLAKIIATNLKNLPRQ